MIIVEPAEDGCHPECMNGCKKSNGGNNAPATSDMCYACQHFNFTGYCVPLCPVGTYETPDKLCSPCSKACATCYGGLPSQCLSCGQKKLLLYSRSFERTGLTKFSLLARNISFLQIILSKYLNLSRVKPDMGSRQNFLSSIF